MHTLLNCQCYTPCPLLRFSTLLRYPLPQACVLFTSYPPPPFSSLLFLPRYPNVLFTFTTFKNKNIFYVVLIVWWFFIKFRFTFRSTILIHSRLMCDGKLELHFAYLLCLKAVVSFLNLACANTTGIICMHFVLRFCPNENFMFKKDHKQHSCRNGSLRKKSNLDNY